MKNPIFLIILLSSLLFIWGCPDGINKHKYYDAWFPKYPVNFTDVNSEYDDLNSALPETHLGKQLIFSSNRRSSGGDYDILRDNLHAVWFIETGHLIVDNSYYWQNTSYLNEVLLSIDKDNNQYAPYAVTFYDNSADEEFYINNLLVYSTNANDEEYRSEFIYHRTIDENIIGEINEAQIIPFLGDVQQQYISFFGPEVFSIDFSYLGPDNFTELIFDKKENGVSNIYSIDIPKNTSLLDFLSTDNDYPNNAFSILNSEANDRCPYVNGHYIVFSSDRAGGYGGYDLYYSFNIEGVWQEPINFGERINTEYDEFRPISVQSYEFRNDLMIFSSNRPGGMGGFDLYYVGIDNISDQYIIVD